VKSLLSLESLFGGSIESESAWLNKENVSQPGATFFLILMISNK
jgi:hypothetical protein